MQRIADRTDDRGAPATGDGEVPEALDLLLQVASLLFANGQTSERTTRTVEHLAESLGLRAQVFLNWGEVRIDVAGCGPAASGAAAVSPLAVEMGKVAAETRVIAATAAAGATTAAVRTQLAAIEGAPPASTLRFGAMAAAGAAALGVIFGVADLASLLLIAASAGAGGVLRRGLGRISANPFVQPACAALLAGLVGAVALRLHLGAAPRLVMVCPCMVLVPGPHLLNGALDLARARIALGWARLLFAGVIVLAICVGLLAGLGLGGAALPASGANATAPLGYDVAAAGVAVAAYGTFFSMPWRLLPIPMAVGMAAHALRWLAIGPGGASLETGALVAGLLAGAITTPLADRLHLPFAALGFASVVSLIPGVFVFQMAGGLTQAVSLGGGARPALWSDIADNGATAFMITLSIAIGLILPKLILDRDEPPMAPAGRNRQRPKR
jgi:uncharacterized membrane protein YjjP (DUF1212 family)